MNLQKLLSRTRKAIDTYKMIDEGDKIAIGISGGKDSLALLYALAELRRFYPKKFELIAITVNLGFPGFETEEIAKLCEKLDVPYYVEDTEIYDIIFNYRKESNPCSLCAKMRKGASNDRIKELGCNKIAYAHNMDEKLTNMECLPESMRGTRYYYPTGEGEEKRVKEHLEKVLIWKKEHAAEDE